MSLSEKIVQVRGRTPANEMNGLFDAEVLAVDSVREAVQELKKRADDGDFQWEDESHSGDWSSGFSKLNFEDALTEIFGEKLI